MSRLGPVPPSGHPLPQTCPLWVIAVWGCVCVPHQTVSPQWAGAGLSLSPLCPQLPGQAFGERRSDKQEMEEGGKDFIPSGGRGMTSQAGEVSKEQATRALECRDEGLGLSPKGAGEPWEGAF